MQTNKCSLAASAIAFSLLSAPVSAGEWKGTTKPNNPQLTPITDLFYVEGRPSICAFSGLNDEYYLGVEGEHTRTQSYGTLVSNEDADPHFFNPGQACNEGNN